MDWLFNLLGHVLYGFSYIMPYGSYALALVLYALVFKIVFLPFTIKQQKNQIKMAKLTPKIELIKAKYRGRTDQVSRQKMQQEIMELQQREGASPFSGCLPMLIQFPIIIWLYKVIRNPLSYICGFGGGSDADASFSKLGEKFAAVGETAVKALEATKGDQIKIVSLIEQYNIDISDLGNGRGLPNLHMFGLDLGASPIETFEWGWGIFICLIPIIAAALQWLTMYLTRRWNGNQNQMAAADGQTNMSMKLMDFMMPLMTLWMTFSFSALMGLYWIFQSVLAIIQTFILSRVMPLPKFTEEELKAMRKEQKAAEKAQRQVLKGGAKYRSLHYIDADDYDELPTMKTNEGTKKSSSFGSPEIKD